MKKLVYLILEKELLFYFRVSFCLYFVFNMFLVFRNVVIYKFGNFN